MKLIVFLKDPNVNDMPQAYDMAKAFDMGQAYDAAQGYGVSQAYDKAAEKIMIEIYKMKPYISVSHPMGSNIIEIDVRWESKDIIPNLRVLQTIEDVQGFLTEYDSLAELEKAATEHDYFKAYSLGCAYFESMGMKILNKYFDGNEVHIGKDVSEHLRLQAITVMLYTHKMISRDTYDDMLCISRIRNTHLIHGEMRVRFVKVIVNMQLGSMKMLSRPIKKARN